MATKWRGVTGEMWQKLVDTSLFVGLSAEEIAAVVHDAGGYVRTLAPAEQLWRQGERVAALGIVLHGAVEAVAYGSDGGEELVAFHGAGEVVGDVLMASGKESPVTLLACAETAVLLLPRHGLLPMEGVISPTLRRVQENLLVETGEKFWQQRRRIAYLLEPRLKTRVLRYLKESAPAAEEWFTLPFDRQGMAQFLGCDRSALSRVLSQLRKEGVIEYRKKEFLLKK